MTGEHNRRMISPKHPLTNITRIFPTLGSAGGVPRVGMPSVPELILASGSRYRRELLRRLVPEFKIITSDFNEERLIDESPVDLAARLAEGKARTVAQAHRAALVIGSDQVAALGDRVLGKPGTAAVANEQLAACSGATVHFFTAVHLTCLERGYTAQHVDVTKVHFRELTATEIATYIQREQPLDCAGSFKSEGLGIALFSAIENRDPTALIGLPMIWLADALRAAGIDCLSPRN